MARLITAAVRWIEAESSSPDVARREVDRDAYSRDNHADAAR